VTARKPSAAQLRVLRNRKAGRAVDYVPRGKPPTRNLNKTIAVCKARGWFQVDRWDGWEHELTPAGREAARRVRG
jgi:hypothetical protein